MNDFVQSWKAAEQSAVIPESEYDLVLSFPDISWLGKVFSPERIRLLQAVRERKPNSVYELAQILGRAQPNVQRDVKELADFGIITLEKIKQEGTNREVLRPDFQWDGFDIAV